MKVKLHFDKLGQDLENKKNKVEKEINAISDKGQSLGKKYWYVPVCFVVGGFLLSFLWVILK